MSFPKSTIRTVIPIVLIPLAVLIALQAIKHFAPKSSPRSNESIEIGHKISDVDMTSQNKDAPKVKLSDLGKDQKLILINFWASWCSACVEEMPGLLSLADKYHDQGLKLILVNLDSNSDIALAEMKKRWPQLPENYTDHDGMLAKKFEISAIPYSLILTSDLTVMLIETGERDWDSKPTWDFIERSISK